MPRVQFRAHWKQVRVQTKSDPPKQRRANKKETNNFIYSCLCGCTCRYCSYIYNIYIYLLEMRKVVSEHVRLGRRRRNVVKSVFLIMVGKTMCLVFWMCEWENDIDTMGVSMMKWWQNESYYFLLPLAAEPPAAPPPLMPEAQSWMRFA